MKLLAIFFFVFIATTLAVQDIRYPGDSNTPVQVDNFYFDSLEISGSLSGVGGERTTDISGVIAPCSWAYFRLDASQIASDYSEADWINIQVTRAVRNRDQETGGPFSWSGNIEFYVKYTEEFTEGEFPLEELPTEEDFDWKISVNQYSTVVSEDVSCADESDDPLDGCNPEFMELTPCEVHTSGVYWFAVKGDSSGSQIPDWDANPEVEFSFKVSQRRPVLSCTADSACVAGGNEPYTTLVEGEQLVVEYEYRPYRDYYDGVDVFGNFDKMNRYARFRYFRISHPIGGFAEGSYIKINITGYENDLGNAKSTEDPPFRLSFGSVPVWFASDDNSLNGQKNPSGEGRDADMTNCWLNDDQCFERDSNSAVDCACTGSNDNEDCEDDASKDEQCVIVLSPCYFRYDIDENGESGSSYFLAVQIPENDLNTKTDPEDYENANFTISYRIESPTVETLSFSDNKIAIRDGSVGMQHPELLAQNVNIGLIQYDRWSHYKFVVAASDLSDDGETFLYVRLFGIKRDSQEGATVFIRKGTENPGTDIPDYNLAGYDIDVCDSNCYADQLKCTSCTECAFTIPKCQLTAGTYYVAVTPEDPSNDFELPIDFHLDIELMTADPTIFLSPGVPYHGKIKEAIHDFFSIVSPNLDGNNMWLYTELFVNARNSEVTLQLLSGDKPGQACYEQGDFICRTAQDVDTSKGDDSTAQSCYFMVDACNLGSETIYLSVFANQGDSYNSNYGTYYGDSVDYTLWVDFESAVEISNNITYSDVVRSGHYNHYYINAADVTDGSSFTVQVTNIQSQNNAGSTSGINAFVNYESLAGQCPCYDSQFNCTGHVDVDCDDTSECDESDLYKQNYGLDNVVYESQFSTSSADYSDYESCEVEVDACTFRSGTWYIGVLGYTPDKESYEKNTYSNQFSSDDFHQTAIGYTLTATIHPGPVVYQITPGTPLVDWVYHQYMNHYKYNGIHEQGHDLIVNLIWNQVGSARYLSSSYDGDTYKHQESSQTGHIEENLLDSDDHWLEVRANWGNIAIPECYSEPFFCRAGRESFSECKLVIPYCKWTENASRDLYFSVRGNYQVDYDVTDDYSTGHRAQFTLTATPHQDETSVLRVGQMYTHSLEQDHFHHYTFERLPFGKQRLDFDLYYNYDRTNWYPVGESGKDYTRDKTWVAFSYGKTDEARGCNSCENGQKTFVCDNKVGCHWSLQSCQLEEVFEVLLQDQNVWSPGEPLRNLWTVSVYAQLGQFFNAPLEYTLGYSISENSHVVGFGEENRFTDRVWAPIFGNSIEASEFMGFYDFVYGQINHYEIPAFETNVESRFALSVSQILFGQIKLYVNSGAPAGHLPCWSHLFSAVCGAEDTYPCNKADCDECLFDLTGCALQDDIAWASTTIFFAIEGLDSSSSGDDKFIQQITYQVQADLWNPSVTAVSPVNVDSGNDVFVLGTGNLRFDFSSQFEDIELVRNWFPETSSDYWATANQFIDRTLDYDQYVHYLVTVSDATALTFVVIDNIRSICNEKAVITAHVTDDLFTAETRYPHSSSSGCTSCTSSTTICSNLKPGEYCFKQLPACENAGQGYYVSLKGSGGPFNPTPTAQTPSVTSNINIFEYDIHFFTQTPQVVDAGTRSSKFNVTHPFNEQKRFLITGAVSGGLDPVNQLVLENFDDVGKLRVWIRPSSETDAIWAGAPQTCDSDGACLESTTCSVEVRNAAPFRDNGSDDDLGYGNTQFYSASGTGYVECNSECTISLMPCLVNNEQVSDYEVLIEHIPGSKRDFVFSNVAYYQIWFTSSAGSDSTTDITSLATDRQFFPETGNAAYQTADQDDYVFFTFNAGEIASNTLENGNYTIQDSQYLELILEMSFSDVDSEDRANVAVYITKYDGSTSPVRALYSTSGDINTPSSERKTFTDEDCCEDVSYFCYNSGSSSCPMFYVPYCELESEATYIVAMRQLQEGARQIEFRVRTHSLFGKNPDASDALVQVIDSSEFVVTDNGVNIDRTEIWSLGVSDSTTSRVSDTATGVAPREHHHFATILDREDFDGEDGPQALVFEFLPDEDAVAGDELFLFVRKGALAGVNRERLVDGCNFDTNPNDRPLASLQSLCDVESFSPQVTYYDSSTYLADIISHEINV